MIRALVVAAIMLVAASLEASAQDRIIFGEAGTSCRTWTQARQTKSRKAGLSAQWVAGYLSGSNVEADHPDVLVGTDFDGLMAWIRQLLPGEPSRPCRYCCLEALRRVEVTSAASITDALTCLGVPRRLHAALNCLRRSSLARSMAFRIGISIGG